MLDNTVVCKDADYIAVWMYILLNATHTQQKKEFDGKIITLQPGQLITGRKAISEKVTTHESKVQRILKRFEIEQQIEQQTSPRHRLITILNWGEYQFNEQQAEQQLNNNRTTTEQQLNTNNKVENDNNDNNECIVKKTPTKKLTKKVTENRNLYGEYKLVKLTTEDYDDLVSRFGEFKIKEYIMKVDLYSSSTGKTYKNYKATILNWLRNDKIQEINKNITVKKPKKISSEDYKKAMKLKEEQEGKKE